MKTSIAGMKMDLRTLWVLISWVSAVISQSPVVAAGSRAIIVPHVKKHHENVQRETAETYGDPRHLGAGPGAHPAGFHYSKQSVFEQGETRDFLQFLKNIKYDHRQRPENAELGNSEFEILAKFCQLKLTAPAKTSPTSVLDPVDIHVSLLVSSIRSVSEITMDYSLELFFRESWTDIRLNWDPAQFKNKSAISLHESYTNFLWHPDTFMPNAIDSKNPQKQSITHQSLLRLQEKGRILYSRRLSVTAECPMDLTLFPFDTQVCSLAVESYGYTADQVRYMWSSNEKEALTLKPIRLPDFDLQEAYVTNHTERYATGDYSRLYVCFVFTRSAGFCFLQLIIPSTAVVITSWVSLWMENETSFQDMISIILTLTFLIFSYNAVMPRVSYIKAMDVYLGVCFFIVFFSLIKLAAIKFMRQRLQMTRETSLVAGKGLPIIRVDRPSMGSIANGLGPDGATLLGEAGAGRPTMEKHRTVELFGRRYRPRKLGSLLLCGGEAAFTSKCVHKFHWVTQIIFLVGFLLFLLFYFLAYPHIYTTTVPEVCRRERAEFFADILK